MFKKRTYSQLRHHLKYGGYSPLVRVKFPSGKIFAGSLHSANTCDCLKVIIGGGMFVQGWTILIRPRLAELIKVEYVKD